MLKKAVSMILAVSLLIFAFSAAAEGGLFSKFMETEYEDERLERLDEVADVLSLSRTEGGVTVEVCQAFYEGDRVFIAYRADGRILEQDGLELEDGTYADIVAGGSLEQDGGVIGWKECVIPEEGVAESQTFCLVYRIPGSDEKQALKFTLKQHPADRYLMGSSAGEGYTAWAMLSLGAVDTKGRVLLTSPEQAASWLAWQEGLEGIGTDVIACWNLYRNGELVSYDLDGSSEVLSDGVGFFTMYPYIEDMEGLTLVPEYSEAGEKPEEAIVLETVPTAEE